MFSVAHFNCEVKVVNDALAPPGDRGYYMAVRRYEIPLQVFITDKTPNDFNLISKSSHGIARNGKYHNTLCLSSQILKH